MPKGVFTRTHQKPIEVRFWKKVKRDGPIARADLGPCWIWTASVDRKNYGRIGKCDGTTKWIAAHRLSYIIHHGPILDGLCVLHKCDNPPCVNPDHLFLGTIKDNSLDMYQKGRENVLRGESQPRSKLNNVKVVEIRALHARGITYAELGRRFSMSAGAMWSVCSRRVWRHVP